MALCDEGTVLVAEGRETGVIDLHLGEGRCLLSESSGNTRLEGGANTPESCAALGKHLNKMERWTENLLGSSKGKRRVPRWGRTEQPRAPGQAGTDLLGSSSGEKDLGALGDSELSLSQHRVPVTKRVNGILGCTGESTARTGETELLQQIQWRVTKMMEGLEHPSEERLRELGLFSLQKMRLRGISSLCVSVCREGSGDGQALLPGAQQWHRRNGQELVAGKFHLNLGKNLFPVQRPSTEQNALRVCGVSLTGDIPDPSGHNPVPRALGWPWLVGPEVGPDDP
ncbi:hypothetical protein DUI87_15687 [Hirundo rustica rustica]|uniref:Uncharacterized protein n=1 Tax=Hirundo rustica rustica TaxID=333673 RepID=A0A3M0JZ70_HIRRU|nr:hypothetical protein DUI87_15687 [Hirundo rustica rustica]